MRSGIQAWSSCGRIFDGARVLLAVSCLAAAGSWSGCGREQSEAEAGHRVDFVQGEIREIAANRGSAVIRHEEIPGFMPRMTMDLTVRDPRELEGLSSGDRISFWLHTTQETHWIDQLRKVGRVEPSSEGIVSAETSFEVHEVDVGDRLPEVTFVDEDGRRIGWGHFDGKVVALTFFFTRCPLPDFCPRMNRNFAEARARLLEDRAGPTNWQFLSISFDAEFDKPAVLKAHARLYRGDDLRGWRFAVAEAESLGRMAPAIDLQVRPEGGTLSHNLRTVVLDARGRVHRMFDGNRWTSGELAEAMVTAAGVTLEPPQRGPGDGADASTAGPSPR